MGLQAHQQAPEAKRPVRPKPSPESCAALGSAGCGVRERQFRGPPRALAGGRREMVGMQHSDAQLRLDRLQALDLKPVGPQQGLVTGTAASLRDILRYRELLVLLVRRELRARYKNSSLGFVWSLVKPVAQLIIYFVVIGKFLGAARSIPEFAIFVFSGLTMWALFNETVTGGAASIVGQLWPDQEGLSAARGLPAEHRRVPRCSTSRSSSACLWPAPWSSAASRGPSGWSTCRPPSCSSWCSVPPSPSCCLRSTSTCATCST